MQACSIVNSGTAAGGSTEAKLTHSGRGSPIQRKRTAEALQPGREAAVECSTTDGVVYAHHIRRHMGIEDRMSKDRPNKWLSFIAWLLPDSKVKRRGLSYLGNQIGRNVKIGPTLVLNCGRFSLGDGAIVSSFNIFRDLSSIDLGPKTYIGRFNQFTAAPAYQMYSPLVGKLIMNEQSAITNRHYFDCSGQIILKPYAGVGGIRSIFQSHEIDLSEDKTTVGRIVLGENAMTGTGCTLLKDSYLPDRSVLAARSLLIKPRQGEVLPVSNLYGGVPARPLKEVRDFVWWERESYWTPVSPFDDQKFRLE